MSDNNRRGRKRRNLLYTPFTFILICTVMIFGMSVFFRISEIEVRGAARYKDAEIIAASGIEQGDNLFFVNRITVMSRIMKKLPYIEKGTISRQLPSRIIIEVSESMAVAYIEVDGAFWSIDQNCKLLGQTATGIRVSGIEPLSPSAGEILAAEAHKAEYLSAVLTAISIRDMQADITGIDFSNSANPSFDYMGRFTVRLGRFEEIDYKFELLLNTVQELSPNDSGTLDLSVDKQVRFMPD